MNGNNVPVEIGRAVSVCPVCLKRIEARKVAYGDAVYLEKQCPEHGLFKTLIWDGPIAYASWARESEPVQPDACATAVDKGCPYDCGLCPDHRQRTCCTVIEVTQRCNLKCPVCFASAGENAAEDPSLETIKGWLQMLLNSGGPFNLQLSGGEPTVRDDLVEIIKMAKGMGFTFLQLNTNGLRLSKDADYAQELRQAGLDCVYLQFDAVSDAPYKALRGRALWHEKQQAVENCGRAGIGVVLVPTLVPGVNDLEIGSILRYAFDHMPAVRGVHFQPVSYFGRHPEAPDDAGRLTLPALLRAIEKQTKGDIKVRHFQPSGGQNAYCGFNGSFLLLENGEIRPQVSGGGCCDCTGNAARTAQNYVARRWSAPVCEEKENKEYGFPGICTDELDVFLERVRTHSLAVSCMVFQDAWNLEIDRVKQCHIHVVAPDGRLVPFCAYNLTAAGGRTLYRPTGAEDNTDD